MIITIFKKTYDINLAGTAQQNGPSRNHFLFPDIQERYFANKTLKCSATFTWTPDNPHIYATKNLVPNYKSDVATVINDDWVKAQNLDGTDVSIVAGEKTFGCHSQILTLRSPYFQSMFNHKMKESEIREVKISDFEPEIVEHFLRFIYTRELQPEVNQSADYLLDSIAIGHKYQEKHFVKMCCSALNEFLQTKALESNHLRSLVDVAFMYQDTTILLDVCYQYILDNPKTMDALPEMVTAENWHFLYNQAKAIQAENIVSELITISQYNGDIRRKLREMTAIPTEKCPSEEVFGDPELPESGPKSAKGLATSPGEKSPAGIAGKMNDHQGE